MAHGLTQSQCNMEAIFQIAAGNDTTATAIRATMLYIMTAPRVYHALRNEIDAAIAKGKVSSPITNAEGAELPYLQAVILEGLRMHPPFQGLSFKVAPPEGDEIDGVFVPGGTWVAPAYRAFTRRPEVFGEDADEFRPERWLEADAGRAAEMRRVVDLVFGYGRWGCAGRFLAFMELNKVFVEVCDDAVLGPRWLLVTDNLGIAASYI
jgi:cytochrome P450